MTKVGTARADLQQLHTGAISQLRVIHALILRETRTRFGRYRLGYLWALLEPLMFMAVFYVGFRMIGRTMPSGMAIIPFLATGILAFFLFRRTSQQVSNAISGNKALLFYPQVQTLDLMVARGALEAATYTLVFFAFVGTHAALTATWNVDSLLHTFLVLGLTALFGFAFGTFLCGLQAFWQTINHFLVPLQRILFWTSGLFFTANELPSRARELLMYNPLLHCTELLRESWFPAYSAYHATFTYPGWWILAFLCVGLHLERAARRRTTS